MPLEEIDGIQLHDRIIARREDAQVAVGPDLAGRVLDGFGKPLDRGAPDSARRVLSFVPGARKPAGPRAHRQSDRLPASAPSTR